MNIEQQNSKKRGIVALLSGSGLLPGIEKWYGGIQHWVAKAEEWSSPLLAGGIRGGSPPEKILDLHVPLHAL